MGAFWFKEEGKKTSTRAMNTSSLQKNENGHAYVMFAKSNPTKMRISPFHGRMVVPRMVATSEKMSSWRF